MKFNVPGSALTAQLQAVSKVINAKNSLAILDNFLFKLTGNELTITGSDSENVLTAAVEVSEVEGEGEFAINAKRLIELMTRVGDQGLTFYIDENQGKIEIVCLNGHFSFMCTRPDEYPRKENNNEEPVVIKVPSSMIAKGIENTLFAVSIETIRPIMMGINWVISQDNIQFAASNTHKLVRYINSEAAPGAEAKFVMPAKPASILRSILPKEDCEVEVKIYSTGATFTFDKFSLSCLFIKGEYPNFGRVIPTDNPFQMTIDRGSFLSAMRRVSLFSSLSSNMVKLSIEPNELILSARDLDNEKSGDERLACNYEGNSQVIGFNGIYLIEVLSNLKCDNVIVKISDPTRPGMIIPGEQQHNEDLLMLLMPMQVFDQPVI